MCKCLTLLNVSLFSTMSASQPQRTIVVTGATGRQGRGIIQALLGDEAAGWLVRGLTSDPSSSKAKQLLSDLQTKDGRLSLAKGSVYDASSLIDAFAGAYGVFAMTSERYPGKVLTEEADMKHEIEAGRNMINAAKECGIKHFVFSSLPNISEASAGYFTKIYHMDNKAVIEQMARRELEGFTSLIPGRSISGNLVSGIADNVYIAGFFYANLVWPQYSRLQEDGVVRFCTPVTGNQPMQWTDPSYDMGTFAASE